MIKSYKEGNEIVYGVRSSRKTDSAFKRATAKAFYGIMKLLGAETVSDHADYRLMSRKERQARANIRLERCFPLLLRA